MNAYLVAAGCLTFLVGFIHSVMGEILIFHRMRVNGGIIPTQARPILKERHVRILWASWHLVTIFGWGIAAILLWLAFSAPAYPVHEWIKNTVLVSMLAASLVVLIGTKGKHLGWLGLLGVAVLLSLA